jgi:hypothetical protein
MKTTAASAAMAATTMLCKRRSRYHHQRECRANYQKSFPKGGFHFHYLQPAEPQGGWIVPKRILLHLTRLGRLWLQLPKPPVSNTSTVNCTFPPATNPQSSTKFRLYPRPANSPVPMTLRGRRATTAPPIYSAGGRPAAYRFASRRRQSPCLVCRYSKFRHRKHDERARRQAKR